MNIQEWKNNGCNYAQGVLLYASLSGHNALLLRRFNQKENVMLKNKLKYELSKLAKKGATPAVQDTPKAIKEVVKPAAPAAQDPPEVVKPRFYPSVVMADLPSQLRPVLERANALYKTNCRLKIDLNEIAPDDDKAAYALMQEIDKNFTENRNCWKEIDFFLENKSFLPKVAGDFDSLTPVQLIQRKKSKIELICKKKKTITRCEERLQEDDVQVNERNRLTKLENKNRIALLKHEQELLEINRIIDGGA